MLLIIALLLLLLSLSLFIQSLQEERRHSLTNCPLAYRHLEESLAIEERERAKVRGSVEVFESLAGLVNRWQRERRGNVESFREKRERERQWRRRK